MAEIIQFGEKRKDQGGSIAGAAALAFQTHKIDDWGNQELADLYRVKRLLEQAGVHVETDRGVSDEGDPWFVFCHPDGEVFVHLCRFDGQYLLDSTAIEAPLRGNSFTDLINQFVDRAIERRAANIVSLRPGDGVYLHPAIMLTALIWTLFVASDELVGIAHGAEIDAAGPDFDALIGAHLTDISDTQGAFGILQAALAEQGDHPVVPKMAELERAQQDAGDREVNIHANAGTGVNAISLSLSAIAVTFGMTSKSTFEFLQNAQAVEAGDAEINLPELFEKQLFASDQNDASEHNLQSDVVVYADAASEGDTMSSLEDAVQKLVAVLNIPQALLPSIGTSPVSTAAIEVASLQLDVSSGGHALAVSLGLRARAATTSSNTPANDTAKDEAQSSSLSLIKKFGEDLTLAEYKVDEQKLLASFDISSLQGQDWLKSLIESGGLVIETEVKSDSDHGPIIGGTIRASTVTEYSEKAMDFVRYMLSKSDTVEMVVLKGKIILVDLSAFDDVADVSYLRNWTHDDVGIISTIGHLSDFEAFDLVVA